MTGNHLTHLLEVDVQDMNDIVVQQVLGKRGEAADIRKEDQDMLLDPDGTGLDPFNIEAVDIHIFKDIGHQAAELDRPRDHGLASQPHLRLEPEHLGDGLLFGIAGAQFSKPSRIMTRQVEQRAVPPQRRRMGDAGSERRLEERLTVLGVNFLVVGQKMDQRHS